MRALVWDGKLRLQALPEPALVPGEAIIRPLLAGVCATDLHLTSGYKGFEGVLGHEFVGVVEHCADPTWLGRRVVGEINIHCGDCASCRRGDTTHCRERTTLGINGRPGTMADRFALPVANLYPVPDGVSDRAAVFAEPLAAALEILDQTHVKPTDRVCVLGDGKLGLLVAQVLRLTGCELHVVGRHPERWGVLRRMGIQPADDINAPGYHSFDLVIDCTGSPRGFEAARALLRPRGRLVLKSTFHGTTQLDLSGIVVDEVTLLGSRCGPFAPALRLLERGLIETEPLIYRTYPLEQAVNAFNVASGQLKVLLSP